MPHRGLRRRVGPGPALPVIHVAQIGRGKLELLGRDHGLRIVLRTEQPYDRVLASQHQRQGTYRQPPPEPSATHRSSHLGMARERKTRTSDMSWFTSGLKV